jgi:WD40 repeat protein
MGTRDGVICVVDCRQFKVVSKASISDGKRESVSAIALDENQRYFAAGSSAGTVKIWDLASTTDKSNASTHLLLAEKTGVHSNKVKGKAEKGPAITSIVVHNDVIYSAGFDGCVISNPFSSQ